MESATNLLDSCASTFSQCGMCTKKEQLKIGVLIISFILGTVDMVTDWINYIQWSSVGGYDQYHFAFIFQTTFLCAAVAGSILWAIEVLLMMNRSRVFLQRRLERSKTEPMPNGGIKNESKWNSLWERMGLIVRLLIGLMEDLPVVVLLHNAVFLPFCGVPAKRESSSPITIATIVSSMLNSMWTMFILYWELCGCNKKLSNAECCCKVIRSVYEPQTLLSICYCGCCGCATISNCSCLCLGQCQEKPITSRGSRGSMKICRGIGRTILYLIIFVIFMGTFSLSGVTIGAIFHYPQLHLYVGPLTKSIKADKIGPGLDSKTDAAMFVTMVYELPNWYHVGLYDNRDINIANSASVYQIQNRLYIGQFDELEHLKNESLTKVIPCVNIFPFVDKIESVLQWDDSQIFNTTDFSNCKLIFRLRYHPINNDWNPITNYFHKFVNFITIEWGINIKDREVCPTGFRPLPVPSLLTDTCSLSCINATDTCREAAYGKFEENQLTNSSAGITTKAQFHLTINDQQHTDFCRFTTIFKYTTGFCNKFWAAFPPVKVPDFVKQSYRQFITVPMTYKEITIPMKYKENDKLWFTDSKCSKLWTEGEKISF